MPSKSLAPLHFELVKIDFITKCARFTNLQYNCPFSSVVFLLEGAAWALLIESTETVCQVFTASVVPLCRAAQALGSPITHYKRYLCAHLLPTHHQVLLTYVKLLPLLWPPLSDNLCRVTIAWCERIKHSCKMVKLQSKSNTSCKHLTPSTIW